MVSNDMLVTTCGKIQMVYFPFYRMAFEANSIAIDMLQDIIVKKKDREIIGEIDKVLKQLAAKKPYSFPTLSNKNLNFRSLIILPNYKCNFSCSYCYSSKGRSNKEISLENLKTGLDHFISIAIQNVLKEVRVSFLGGGEPILSWDLLVWSYEYLDKNLSKDNIKILFSITTNGSLLNDDYIQWIAQRNVHVNVSFEILPDIQNTQRGQFDEVSQNIKKMLRSGINISIRSTITENNVLRMEEMVRNVLTHYPTIKKLHFEPVTQELESSMYYSNFIKYFFRARQLASENGIKLICSITKSFSSLRKRFCGGELCLTPDGLYTICHRSSSPMDKNFNSFVYGKIVDNQVQIDDLKVVSILKKNIFDYDECKQCIAKWHCAGGCLFQRMNYDKFQMQNTCDFTKKIISLLLLEKINKIEFDKIINSNQIINL